MCLRRESIAMGEGAKVADEVIKRKVRGSPYGRGRSE